MKIKQFLALSPIVLALLSAPALAERPMVVDDAGTLDLYGKKLEFGFTRDHKERGWEVVAGFSPIENLEVELNGGRSKDNPAETKFKGTGIGLKWVPIKAEHGLSAGVKAELGRTRITDPTNQYTERTNSLIGLATWTTEAEQRIHLNLGRDWTKVAGTRDGVNTWGVGFDQPLRENLRLTLETFGNEDSRPDRQIGLRWEVSEGLKLSVGVGRGNDRNFGSAGVAWEF